MEIRKQKSLRLVDFAKLLEISEAYLSMLEKGRREPSLALIQRLINLTEIPAEKWISSDFSPDYKDISLLLKDNARVVSDLKKRLNREHREHMKSMERIWELEQAKEHLLAEISLREISVKIICTNSLSKGEKLKRLEELAIWATKEGELSFDEILNILKLKRSVLRNWLDTQKYAYECRFADGGKILACSPGEAAICLRCFDCMAFESGECLGHGDEKQPENIADMLDRLRINGVYDSSDQACILEKYYGLTLTANDIANIRYRIKKGLPVPDDVFYLDIREDR